MWTDSFAYVHYLLTRISAYVLHILMRIHSRFCRCFLLLAALSLDCVLAMSVDPSYQKLVSRANTWILIHSRHVHPTQCVRMFCICSTEKSNVTRMFVTLMVIMRRIVKWFQGNDAPNLMSLNKQRLPAVYVLYYLMYLLMIPSFMTISR